MYWGYTAIKAKVEIHDLHPTMLYPLGVVDRKRQTFRLGGRNMRRTDVLG